MKNGMNFRQKAFWFYDTINGKRVKKALNFTQKLLDHTQNKDLKERLNRRLLNHAISTTVFYNKQQSQGNLECFPIINKNIIRDNFDDFISSKFKVSKCRKVSTSGSTGSPFSVYQDSGKVLKNIADNIYFSSKSNYSIGDFLVYVKIWDDKISLKKLVEFQLKNIQPWNVFNLSDNEIKTFIEKLNIQTSSICLIGYASSFEKICIYLDQLNHKLIEFKTKSIITISESLNDYTRKSVKKHFGIEPLSRYSNNENGVIAQQIWTGDLRFKINDSSYIVEIFDLNSDRRLGYGERGRIVITDLYNLAMPLIRYDTGDVGVMQLDENQKPYFEEVSGRALDLLYDTKGNLVPSHLSAKLCKYGNFKQFQLVQKGLKDYEVNLNTTKKVNEHELISEYKSYFGVDATIRINYVNDIPLLGSGKRREVVNEYYNTI